MNAIHRMTVPETPVIFRECQDGQIIALLPTIPVEGINSAIVAYSAEYGWFTSDTSVMHSTVSPEGSNTWPILAKLVKDEGIAPIKIVKRITEAMNEIRLDRQEYSCYRATA